MINLPGESALSDEALLPPPPPLRPRSSQSLVAEQRVQVPDWIHPDNPTRLRGAEGAQQQPKPVAEYDLAEDSPAPQFKNRRLMPAPHIQREERRLALNRAAATTSRGLA